MLSCFLKVIFFKKIVWKQRTYQGNENSILGLTGSVYVHISVLKLCSKIGSILKENDLPLERANYIPSEKSVMN